MLLPSVIDQARDTRRDVFAPPAWRIAISPAWVHSLLYDSVSNPKVIESNLPTPGPGSDLPGDGFLRFDYDGVDRLKQATGNTLLAPGKDSHYVQGFDYSASHNLTRKVRFHGVSQPSGSVSSPPKTNIDLDYKYGARPHLPTQVGDLVMQYDPSGNPVSRRTESTGRTEHMSWDDDGRLVEINGAGINQKNAYDASGLRVVRQGRSCYASNCGRTRAPNCAPTHFA